MPREIPSTMLRIAIRQEETDAARAGVTRALMGRAARECCVCFVCAHYVTIVATCSIPYTTYAVFMHDIEVTAGWNSRFTW